VGIAARGAKRDTPPSARPNHARMHAATNSGPGGAIDAAAAERVGPRACSSRCAAALALGALIPFALLVWRFDFLCDDAFISFRYARNLGRGLGAVYNPGVHPPVEGYTEFLWVVLLAGASRLGLSLEVVSRVLSAAAGGLLVVLVVRTCWRRTAPTPWALAATAAFVGTLTPLAVWSTGGLATAPFALACFVVFERLHGEPGRHHGTGAGLAAAAVVLLRADGAYWVAVLLGLSLLAAWRSRDACLARAAGWAVGLSLGTFLLHLGWRWSVYADWLPNTARTKIGLDASTLARGVRYVAGYAAEVPSVVLAAALPLAFARRCLFRPTVIALATAGATVAYAVAVGGDFMCFGRFLVPALPFVAVLFSRGAYALEEDGRRGVLVPFTAVLVALSLLPAWDRHPVPEAVRRDLAFRHRAPEDRFRSEYEQWRFMRDNALHWAVLGRALALHTQPGDSVVLGAVGAAGYYSDRFVYDRFGLVTRGVRADPDHELSSPGHDVIAERSSFQEFSPTYEWVKVVQSDREVPRYARRAPERLERVPLDPDPGFPAGSVLLLLRSPDASNP